MFEISSAYFPFFVTFSVFCGVLLVHCIGYLVFKFPFPFGYYYLFMLTLLLFSVLGSVIQFLSNQLWQVWQDLYWLMPVCLIIALLGAWVVYYYMSDLNITTDQQEEQFLGYIARLGDVPARVSQPATAILRSRQGQVCQVDVVSEQGVLLPHSQVILLYRKHGVYVARSLVDIIDVPNEEAEPTNPSQKFGKG